MPMISDTDYSDKHAQRIAWAITWRVVLFGSILTNLAGMIIGIVPDALWGFYQASRGTPIEQASSFDLPWWMWSGVGIAISFPIYNFLLVRILRSLQNKDIEGSTFNFGFVANNKTG